MTDALVSSLTVFLSTWSETFSSENAAQAAHDRSHEPAATPELNALVRILNEVLTLFFAQELPPVIGELAWEVVKEAKLADEAMRGGYKVPADPHIFSDVCEFICEAMYDFFYNEGFLDLPGDWRARLSSIGAV